ncbi:MAG: HlyD family type I secretion periplasmic adaptor subunit, partial [Endozoicomonas sp.]
MFIICMVLTLSLLISWFGVLDTEAIAEGKIIPVGQVKIIQSLIAGRVENILVKEGDRVSAGQVLVRLNRIESMADVHALESNQLYLQLNEGRTRCLLATILNEQATHPNLKAWFSDKPSLLPSPPTEEQWTTQQQLLDFDYAFFSSSDNAMVDAINQRQATIEAIQSEIERYHVLLPLYEEQERNIKALYEKSHASKTEWLSAREKQVSAYQQLMVEKNRLQEAKAALASATSERGKQSFNFQQSRMQQINEFNDKLEELRQALRKARERDSQTNISSPVSGTVHHLEIHSRGAVVEPAKPLMTIVPDEAELQVEAMVLNKDIGFIQEGMPVDIKIESFPYTFYGYLGGVVQSIARDAVVIPEQGLVYPAYIHIDRQSVLINGKNQPLQAGMVVSAEVKTGTRRALEFFIEPFLRYRDEAFN